MPQKKSFAIYEKRHASGNVGFRVDLGLVKGKRSFKSFEFQKDAEAFRDRHLKAEAQKHPHLLADINDVTRHEVLGALARLKEYNASLTEAVDFFLKHARPAIANASIQKVMDDFESVKRKAGLSTKYIDTAKASFFVPFRDHFKNCVVTDLSTKGCEQYIYRSKQWNATTRATHIRHLSVLFNFAVSKGYMALNPFNDVQRPKRLPSNAHDKVLPVENVIKLLQYAYTKGYKPECAALVLVMFCGVRMDEVTHISWDKIKLEENKPVVVLDKTKANRRRVNIIPRNALAWLKELWTEGQIVGQDFEGRMKYLRKASKSLPKQNSARICFASYHVAMWEDPAKTSMLLGHKNPALLWNTYRALVGKQEAKRYWQITPDYTGDIKSAQNLSSEEIRRMRGARLAMATKKC